MECYESLSTQLKECKEGVFVPSVTLDDPGIEQSLKTIDMLIEADADALELGIPFSDPLANGPAVQNTTPRTLVAGVTPVQCFEVLTLIRQKHPTIPISLLMYANLMFNGGIDKLYAEREKVGVDSVLVADVLVEESAPSCQAALRHNVAPIFVRPLNADDDLLCQIASYGRGYTYLPSWTGMTGTESRAVLPLNHLVAKPREYDAAPSLQGPSISAPDQVKVAIDTGAADTVSGSATTKIIKQHISELEKMLAALKAFVQLMRAATRG